MMTHTFTTIRYTFENPFYTDVAVKIGGYFDAHLPRVGEHIRFPQYSRIFKVDKITFWYETQEIMIRLDDDRQ